MLTLIRSEQPRLAFHVDMSRIRPWTGIVWTGGVRDSFDAHWDSWWDRGVPLLMPRRPLWHPGFFAAFDREWILLHGREDFLDTPPVFLEFQRRLTRSLLDRLGLSTENVLSVDEAWDSLGFPRRGLAPLWDPDSFRASL